MNRSLSWKDVLGQEREKEYFKGVLSFIERQRLIGKKIHPENHEIFSALQMTPFADVKVIILGQDPYHGPGQAHGLSFSVKPGVAQPPSLQNIFKELTSDLKMPTPTTGYLRSWAEQGVLLLNAVLTVEENRAGSHANLGWEIFTDRIVFELAQRKNNLVFMLWGSYAQKKAESVGAEKHLILKAPHPSPLSAHRGFLGCRHFSMANEYLRKAGYSEINWTI